MSNHPPAKPEAGVACEHPGNRCRKSHAVRYVIWPPQITTESNRDCSVQINLSEMLENNQPPYRTHKSQEVLRQNGFETGFWPTP